MASKIIGQSSSGMASSSNDTGLHISELPNEMLDHILSFLSKKDLEITSFVSRQFCQLSQRSEVSKLDQLLTALCTVLEADTPDLVKEIEAVRGLLSSILEPQKMLSLVHNLNDIKGKIFNILKRLSYEQISNLEGKLQELSLPQSFDNFIKSLLNIAHFINGPAGSLALQDIPESLVKKGSLQAAKDLADFIVTNEDDKSVYLFYLSRALAKNGHSKEAKEFAESIPNISVRNCALKEISKL